MQLRRMNHWVKTLILLSLLVPSRELCARIIYQKLFPDQGTLACDVVNSTNATTHTTSGSPGVGRRSGQVFVCRILWTSVLSSAPQAIWQLDISKDRIPSGAAPFLPLDACISPDGRLFLIFRTDQAVHSAELRFGEQLTVKEANTSLIVRESRDDPARIFGAGSVACDWASSNRVLTLDGTRGEEVFEFDGKSWQHRGVRPYKPFTKAIAGIGNVSLEQTALTLPDLPTDYQARRKAQWESAPMKALLEEVSDDSKTIRYIQSLHRQELFLIRNDSSERVSLFKRTTFFDPHKSRCPTGFRVLDVLAFNQLLYIVFKEQSVIRCAVVEISAKGSTTKAVSRIITSEDHHLTYSTGSLTVPTGGKVLHLELNGSAGKRAFRQMSDQEWSEIPVEDGK